MRWPSPAMIVALIALIVAMGGTGYAAATLPRNSVGTAQIKQSAVVTAKVRNAAITTAKLKNGAVTTAKIANGAITGAKIADGAIGAADLSDAARAALRAQGAAAFRVGATDAPAENPGETATLDDFAVTAPTAGHLLIDLRVVVFDRGSGLVCTDSSAIPAISTTIDGTPIADLGGTFFPAAQIIDSSSVALVPVGAGRHEVIIRLTCPGYAVRSSVVSTWTASGALYATALDATTSTG